MDFEEMNQRAYDRKPEPDGLTPAERMIWLALRALWENLGTPRLRSWLLFTVLFVLMNAAVGPLSVLPSYLVLVAAAGLPSAATGRAVPGRSR